MYECETCSREFYTARSCSQHMNDTRHWAPRYNCETCTSQFRSVNAANQHMNALRHWKPNIPCETCSQKFHTETAAAQHMKANGHYVNYCASCDRHFENDNNLKMVSVPLRNLNESRRPLLKMICSISILEFIVEQTLAAPFARMASPQPAA